MAQETLNIVITADNKQAITNINQTIQSTTELGESLKKMPAATNRATMALSDFSRIAQDAPYGIRGIANNLNPMLESFQRLAADTKNTGGPLKAMIAALSGPAGLGVALGVVSSLAVAFGDDIVNFISKLVNSNNSLKEHAESLHASQKAYIDAYTEVYKLGAAFDAFHSGLMSKKDLLAQYNTVMGDVYGKTNDVNEAEKIWTANSSIFIQSAILRAASLLQIAKAGKAASDAFETQQKPKENFTSAGSFIGAGPGAASAINLSQQADKARLTNQKEIVDGLKKEEEFHKGVAAAIDKEVKLLAEKALHTKFFDTGLPKTGTTRVQETQAQQDERKYLQWLLDVSAARKKREKESGGTGMIDLYDTPDEKVDKELKRKAAIAKFGKSVTTGDFGKMLEADAAKRQEQYNLESGRKDAQLKAIKDQNDAYLKFADTISGAATNAIMGLWDAMQQGVPIGEALGDMFANLAKQIAAAAIKAAIFTGIAMLLGVPGTAIAGGASTATTAGGGFMGIFGKLLGLADGGVVTKPTLAMVGEGNEHEAVMPLSKLSSMMSSTFNAGSMSGSGGAGSGQFILKGNDLVLALQRSNYSLNLRR